MRCVIRRHKPVQRWVIAAAVGLVGVAFAQPPVSYADLAVILDARCIMCHAGAGAPLGLRLDSEAGLLAGSERGAVVVAGDPDASEIVRRLRGEALPRMPLTGPPYLDDAEIDLFVRWIAGLSDGGAVGATAPDPEVDTDPETGTEPEQEPPNDEEVSAGGDVHTYADVQPLFLQNCVRCHARQGLMGGAPEGYRLDTYEETLRADDRARVVPFAPDASELVRRIRGHALPRMPFDGPPYLSAVDIERIVAWIEDGARDVDGTPADVPVGAEVRLHGTWREDGTLDGLLLRFAAGARTEDDAAVGGYVEVRGVLASDGSVIVERIRGR